jgi:hypothetical protein
MTVTGLFNETAVEIELVNFVRNQNIVSTTDRGVTTTTQTFSGNGVLTQFTVSNTPLANVRSITISAVAQTYGTDYAISGNVITFNTAPASGTNNISVQYDYGVDDNVVTATSQSIATISTFPCVVAGITTSNSEEGDISGDSNFTNALITFTVMAIGKANTQSIITSLREAILNNKKNFSTLRYLTPVTSGPNIPQANKGDKIYLKTLECRAPLIEEVIS